VSKAGGKSTAQTTRIRETVEKITPRRGTTSRGLAKFVDLFLVGFSLVAVDGLSAQVIKPSVFQGAPATANDSGGPS